MRRLLTVVLHDGTEHDIELRAPESTQVREIEQRFTQEWGPPQRTAFQAIRRHFTEQPGRPADEFLAAFDRWFAQEAGDPSTADPSTAPPSAADPSTAGVRELERWLSEHMEEPLTALPYPGPLVFDPGSELTATSGLFVAGAALPRDQTLAESPLRDGVRVGFGRWPPADPVPQGDYEYEVRIVAGEGAGTVRTLTSGSMRTQVRVHTDQAGTRGVVLRLVSGDRIRVRGLDGTVVQLRGRVISSESVWRQGELLTAGRSIMELFRVADMTPVPGLLTAGDGGTLLFRRPPRRSSFALVEAVDELRELDRTPRWWFRRRMDRELERQVRDLDHLASAAMGRRWSTYPSAAEVRSIAVHASRRLWERRPSHHDFLVLRWGWSTTQPADVSRNTTVPGAAATPGTVHIADHCVTGVAGPGDGPRRLAAWLAAQVAVLHGPDDVVLRVFTDPQHAADWSWLRWLPHASSALDEGNAPRVVADSAAQAHHMGVLLGLITERQRAGNAPENRAVRTPVLVLFLDGAGRLRSQPGMTRLLQEGPGVGVYVVCVESEVRALPSQCRAVIGLSEDGCWYQEPGGSQVAGQADLVPGPWFDQVARALAPLRDVDTERRAYDLREAPLPALLGLEPPDPRLIAARWSAVPRSTAAVVGRAGGSPFELDLCSHGPHALIAGATGSGKTEFLRTWVASLAVANRADELMFVLIDYKAGSAFGSLTALPHVTSMIVDLDSHQVDRVLTRLNAALRDREAQLAGYGAANIEDYHALRDRRRDLPPLPRLVVVVDEFSALVRELPDLVSGLVATAQRGRSLGVHLVLATQRPSGVLSADLLAATNLRIALRLVDAAESRDIIGAADAAAILASCPGRAFVRTGVDDMVEFQTAKVGGRQSRAALPPAVGIREMDAVGALPPDRPEPGGGEPAPTDLERLVTAVRRACAHLGVLVPPGPLPPPLPTVVTLSQLPPLALAPPSAASAASAAPSRPRVPSAEAGGPAVPGSTGQRPAEAPRPAGGVSGAAGAAPGAAGQADFAGEVSGPAGGVSGAAGEVPGPAGQGPGGTGEVVGPGGSGSRAAGRVSGSAGEVPSPVGEVPSARGDVLRPVGGPPGSGGEAPGPVGEGPGSAGEVSGLVGQVPGSAGEVSGPAGEGPGSAGEVSGPAGGVAGSTGVVPGPEGAVAGPAGRVSGPQGRAQGSPAGAGRDLVAFGLEEAPDELAQRAALFDLATDAALAVGGAPRSGRSQFLRTFAAAAARQHSTADVHLFAIDCGDGALQALTGLPHCGAVVTRSQPERLARLLSHLTATVYARRQLLAAAGFSGITAQRQAVPAGQRLPYLVLLLDRWEEFETLSERLDRGRLVAELQRLLAEGAGEGVRVVVTGGLRVLSGRMAGLVQHQLALNLPSRPDYQQAGIDPQLVPHGLNPGRAFRAYSAVEVQIALLDGVPTTRGQTDALARLAAELSERDAAVPEAQRPFRIDDVPRAAEQFEVGAGRGRPVGREDVLAWLRDRHAAGASAALLGPRRAGKTWVLEELSRRLVADGYREVHQLVVPQASSAVDSPDALAAILDRGVRGAAGPAEALLDAASAGTRSERLVFLLDEVGRLAGYDPAAVSWLRDLGQAGAWLVYTGTEKDWRAVVRHALTAPGSSFGNDVNARALGPLGTGAALDFLSGTAANLGVSIGRDTTAARIVEYVGTWPFYLQVVGDAVVSAVHGNDLRPLTSGEALDALIVKRLLDEWTHHFRARWAEIGPAGRAALLAEPGAVPRDASPAQRQDLRDVGLLRPGEMWLHDPPFLGWIARNVISLRDGELPA